MFRGEDPDAAKLAVEHSGLPGAVLAHRSARKDGREVASLSCFAADGSYIVQCELQPLNGAHGKLLTRGPYRFATLGEANAFLDEAGRALEYLGCNVS